jgi:hypothetical protein
MEGSGGAGVGVGGVLLIGIEMTIAAAATRRSGMRAMVARWLAVCAPNPSFEPYLDLLK